MGRYITRMENIENSYKSNKITYNQTYIKQKSNRNQTYSHTVHGIRQVQYNVLGRYITRMENKFTYSTRYWAGTVHGIGEVQYTVLGRYITRMENIFTYSARY